MNNNIEKEITALWQRLVTLENTVTTNELKEDEAGEKVYKIFEDLENRTKTLENARTQQREINTKLLKMFEADPDKEQSPLSWWKKLVG